MTSTTTHPHTNRLIHATSPYLLQHAHNPVDWYEWGPEALQRAREEDKPILVSIGYSSCHWCHVMERLSFEREEIAAVMNQHYVCIKVDREERPDIDQIYMDAVQALGVHGGWPLNVFLTSEQKPFFGGTYFAPETWVQVLQNIQQAFVRNRKQIEDSAEELRLHLLRSDVARFKQTPEDSELRQDMDAVYQNLSQRFDHTWGGLDRAPKFVMPSIWQWLLRYHYITHHQPALDHLNLSLKKIAMGGICDQVGGGFARYSVDAHWFVPHFEKMLYDNAQLMSLYAEAWQVTRDPEYKTIVYETFQWLQREMTSPEGGFYSALDADSEGLEGKYYLWTQDEWQALLGKEATRLGQYYAVTPSGNWEHDANILIRYIPDEQFLQQYQLSAADWQHTLQQSKARLLAVRQQRIAPALDDKIITAWNAMMVVGLTDAYRAFGDALFLDAALRNMKFLEQAVADGSVIYRSYKGRRSTSRGFLDDYAYVIKAQIQLYQVTFDEHWLKRAAQLMGYVQEQFYDPQDGFFHYAPADGEVLIARKKEIFDNVIPSSNGVMALNLFQLGTLLDKADWQQQAIAMTTSLLHLIRSEPNYMSHWAIVYQEIRKGLHEVVWVGPEADRLRAEFQRDFHPYAVSLGSTGTPPSTLPLVADKGLVDDRTTIYVCYQKTCQLPVHQTADALRALR